MGGDVDSGRREEGLGGSGLSYTVVGSCLFVCHRGELCSDFNATFEEGIIPKHIRNFYVSW